MSDNLLYGVIIMVVIAASATTAVLAPSQAPAIVGLGTLIVVQLLALLKNAKTVEKVETVEKKLDAVGVTTDATHTLTNSRMGAQLLLARSQAKRIMDDHPNEQSDKEAYELADSIYKDHMASQHIVDAGQKLVPAPTVVPPTEVASPAAEPDKVEVVITGDDVKVVTADKPTKKETP